MKRRLCLFKFLASFGFAITASNAVAAERPNIVFMLSDDQGWSGLSVSMHPTIASKGEEFHTPNLEKLASQGMRFSAGYAPAPVCSPTRISLQTGKSPAQLHWTKAAPAVAGQKMIEPTLIKNIASSEITIGEQLKKAGYATAHYGKWHIAGGGPEQHGYEESDGDTGNENAYKFVDPNPVDIFGMAERSAKFMEKSAKAGKPFFIQLSWNALHASENALKATLAKYEKTMGGDNSKRVTVAAITEDLDTGVGMVMEAIDRLKLTNNTYIVYMGDNGSGGGRKSLSGGKGDLWEGGIRVPFIVRGPGVKADSWCHTRVVGYDLYPTFCEIADINLQTLPKDIEGGSILSLMKHAGQGEVKRSREEMFFHFPHYQSDDGPHSAIYLGDLKLLRFYETDTVKLFDLAKDIGERNDLSNKMPKETAELKQRLEKYLSDINAQFATMNPDYDPNKPVASRRGGKGGGGKGGGGKGGGGKGGGQGGRGKGNDQSDRKEKR
jgi:arylsulfatase A-like enzyme